MKRMQVTFALLTGLFTATAANAGVSVVPVYDSGRLNDVFACWTAGQTGTYIVTIAGGSGGGARGGAGAIMMAQFEFTAGDRFRTLIGGAGQKTSTYGDGGSGTFFTKYGETPTLLLAAGGGGGGAYMSASGVSNTVGQNANFTTSGGWGRESSDGEKFGYQGGMNGGAGGGPVGNRDAGGGGFFQGRRS